MKKHLQPRTELAGVLFSMRRYFIIAGAFSLVINLLALTPSIYMLQVYDRVLASRNEVTLLALTVIMLGLFALSGALEFVRSRLLVRISSQIDEALNSRVFTAAFENNLRSAGGNAGQALGDMSTIRQFLTGNGLFAFFDAPWMPIYLLILFLFAPLLGWLAVAGALALIGLAIAQEILTRKPLAESQLHANRSSNFATNNLRNAEVIEAMGMLGGLMERWYTHHGKALALQAYASDKAGSVSTLSKFVRISIQSLVLGAGALLAIEGKISPGAMIAGSIIMGKALGPVDLMISTWKQLIQARTSYARLDELLQRFPQRDPGMPLPRPLGRLQLENVMAQAPGTQHMILRGVTFAINPGEVVGVIGPSASGKSTLARLMVGVWPAVGGKVRLDGADVFTWNKAELGPYIGYLPQDVELFSGTVAENIARFSEVDSAAVVEAAQLAGVHEMILRLPNGYDTPIGEGGSNLSGGQRQRLGLARALYRMPSLIVLDEPNSNLDDVGEKALVGAVLAAKQRGSTVILITHRTAILAAVDKLLVMADGASRLFGPRDQVLASLNEAVQQQAQQLQQQAQIKAS
ncbi:type I secretion system permease/ATPase [Chitinilyticum litopenaei]|uniref:type I secretion system permease/ATPase n=1 Tax=Chitinilyticum litopenaei TaxID=1121276 RepID=UPI0005BB240F|nr:type I secretion system permease/ATPase [Chitinilyticum litopenaei]